MKFMYCVLLCLFATTHAQAADTNDGASTIVIDSHGVAHGTGFRKGHKIVPAGARVTYDATVLKDLPASFDLRAMGDVSPIKDQGQCGSCWAHATTESLEDAILFAGNPLMQLSAEQMTVCNSSMYGCGGGEMTAGDYLVNPGLALDKDFPYDGGASSCPGDLKTAAKAKSWAYVGAEGRAPTNDEIKSALVAHGSIFVTVAASGSDWGGQAEMTDCSDTSIDHMTEIVGWKANGEWIMRNSWGTSWGDAGFAYMPYGCDSIATDSDSAAYTVF